MNVTRPALLMILLLSGMSLSCGSSGTTGPDLDSGIRIDVLAGADQVGPQFEHLSSRIRIRASVESGESISGLSLRASVEEGDAVLVSSSGESQTRLLTTDDSGEAEVAVRLGEDRDNRIVIGSVADPDASASVVATSSYVIRDPVDIVDGWPVGALTASDENLHQFMLGVEEIRRGTYPEIHSLLIVQRDSLRFEDYWPGHDSQNRLVDWSRDTPHEAQSATKSFRSAIVGIAVDRGHIPSVEQTIEGYFPEYTTSFDDLKSRITVQDLLTMSSGIDWDETGAASGGTDNTLSMMYARPLPEWTGYVLSRPMAHEPGEVYVYNTGASIMLGDLVQRASGTLFTNFVREYMQEPMEMTRLPGIGFTAGATILPRDMARLGQVYLRRGIWKDTRIVSEEFVEESFVERFEPAPGIGYGYQWWSRTIESNERSYRVRYASGNGGQTIIIIDELEAVVTWTGGNFGLNRMHQVFPFMEQYILQMLE